MWTGSPVKGVSPLVHSLQQLGLGWVSTPETMLRWLKFVVPIEEIHILPMHQSFHDIDHNASETYGLVVFRVMFASLLMHRGDIGTGPVRQQLTCYERLIKEDNKWFGESQGASSFNGLPGIQSGPQALEGSMRLKCARILLTGTYITLWVLTTPTLIGMWFYEDHQYLNCTWTTDFLSFQVKVMSDSYSEVKYTWTTVVWPWRTLVKVILYNQPNCLLPMSLHWWNGDRHGELIFLQWN